MRTWKHSTSVQYLPLLLLSPSSLLPLCLFAYVCFWWGCWCRAHMPHFLCQKTTTEASQTNAAFLLFDKVPLNYRVHVRTPGCLSLQTINFRLNFIKLCSLRLWLGVNTNLWWCFGLYSTDSRKTPTSAGLYLLEKHYYRCTLHNKASQTNRRTAASNVCTWGSSAKPQLN